jgi:hypothetical protein
MKKKKIVPPKADKKKPATGKINSLEDLEHFELSGSESKEESIAASDTDEHASEGTGDGNIGRSSHDILRK